MELVEEETSRQVTRVNLIRNSEKVLQVLREVKCKIKPFWDLQRVHWEMSRSPITKTNRRNLYSLPEAKATSQIPETKPR